MYVGWNLNDSTTSLLPNILFSKMNALHQKCVALTEYIDSAHTEVEDLFSRYMNGSDAYDRYGHDTRLLHPSCTACRRTSHFQDRLDRMKLVRDRTLNIRQNCTYLSFSCLYPLRFQECCPDHTPECPKFLTPWTPKNSLHPNLTIFQRVQY